MPWKTVGEYIRERLRRTNKNQSDLSRGLKMKDPHTSRLVLDKVTPSPITCVRLARFFGDDPFVVWCALGYAELRDQRLTESETAFVLEWRQLVPRQKKAVDEYIRLLNKAKKTNSPQGTDHDQ